VTIKHRELVQSVILEQGDLDAVSLSVIQPGCATLFPWLSTIAARFQRYRFDSLRFDYIPRCPTSTPGCVILSFNPDPDDAIVAPDEYGRQRLLVRQSVEASSWASASFPVPKDLLMAAKERFIRTSLSDSTIEPRSADFGTLTVGCFGFDGTAAANLTLGDLFVEYTIALIQPEIPDLYTPSAGDARYAELAPQSSTTFRLAVGVPLTQVADGASDQQSNHVPDSLFTRGISLAWDAARGAIRLTELRASSVPSLMA